jgi:signal transduction histidine kinase
MYFKDSQNKEFVLKSEYYNHKIPSMPPLPKELSSSNPFIAYLENAERPLIVEEEKFKLNHSFFNIDAGLVVPCITKMGLVGIIFLGNKPNNQLYTEDDLLTFDTLAAQASLAIENCQFAQELADKERVARLQDMDVYSYSLAHEIDNPAQVITAGVAYLQKQLLKELQLPQATEKDIDDSLNLILEAARRISSMVKAIRDYGSTLNEDLKPLKIEDVIESFSYLISYRFKDKGILLTKEISPDLGYIRGQKPELIQVLEIFANNSIHAMSQSEVKKVQLKVFQPNPDTIRITFTDTGYGIDNKILHLIFSPFTTTKASTEGTGMGLANAKKIIERHKGKIWAESEGKDKGATFVVELPVAKDISQEEFKKEDKGKMIF